MQNSVNKAWKYVEDRFGVEKSEMEEYRLLESSGDIWIVSSDFETELEVETYGIRFIRFTGMGMKPTTYALQLISGKLSKNIINVNEEELLKLLRREEMIDRELEEEGYVAIKYEDRIIGCGFYKNEKVSSRIPKGRSKELASIVEEK